MRVEFDASRFKDAFGLAASASPARSPKPELLNVLLSVADGVATLMGTDLELTTIATLPADGEPLSALLPVDRVSSVLRTWAEPTLPIEVDDAGLAIGSGRSRFKFRSGDPSTFPESPAIEPVVRYELATDLLDGAFRKTAFAIDMESARYALGGVAMEADGATTIDFVGTDGRRLAWFTADAVLVAGDAGKDAVVVPPKTTRAIVKAVKALGPMASVGWDHAAVEFAGTNATIRSRLVEGRYPRWRDVLPLDPVEPAMVDAAVLATAVAQAAVATSLESRGVDFTLSAGLLALSAEAADVGSAAVEMDVATPDAQGKVVVTLDPRYLLDSLRTLAEDATVAIRIAGPREPVLLSADRGCYQYVIMPLTRDRGGDE